MKYVTYYEESDMLSKEKYKELKQELLTGNTNTKLERYTLRKLQFSGNTTQEAVPNYFLCMRNRDENQIYLEKKYLQGGIYYKKCIKLTKEECDKILNGELEWMKEHKEKVLAEFYLQLVLNHLSPGFMTEYKRERIRSKKEKSITFSKSVRRAVGTKSSLFEDPEIFISCLDEKKVQTTYRKTANLPDVIINMLQTQEEPAEEYGYA